MNYLIILSFLICSSTAIGEEINKNYLDTLHDTFSNKVIDYSQYIDDSINDMFDNLDINSTDGEIKSKKFSIDNLFHDKKFIEETDENYISINMDSNFNDNGTREFSLALNMRIPLSKSSKKYNIFIENLTKSSSNSPLEKQSGTEIGINYFTLLYSNIQSKYSIGLNGLNLFTVARFSVERDFLSWKIEPTQKFKYSIKYDYEEESNIYFDKQLSVSRLFRITLSRATKVKSTGMDYGLSLAHYWSFGKNTAMSLSQSFLGNTEYKYMLNDSNIVKKDRGITHYKTELNFRKSVLREWFFYGLTPSVNFQKKYEYKTNYQFKFYLEIYFGHI